VATSALRSAQNSGRASIRNAGLDSKLVCLEDHEIVVGEHHPLATRSSVQPDDLRPYTIWIPGIVDGSEWGDFYRELASEFDLTIDSTRPSFGFEDLLETVAASRSSITFWGGRTRAAGSWPHGVRRLRVENPTLVYPWSLIWHTSNRHLGLTALIEHLRRTQVTDPAGVWLPKVIRGSRVAPVRRDVVARR
jgi:DNA-binding transcriptional LysR family regulator